MPFLRAKGLQLVKHGHKHYVECKGLNALPAGEGSATGSTWTGAIFATASQCPSCGRRVCNTPGKMLKDLLADVSMPFLRAKGLQPLLRRLPFSRPLGVNFGPRLPEAPLIVSRTGHRQPVSTPNTPRNANRAKGLRSLPEPPAFYPLAPLQADDQRPVARLASHGPSSRVSTCSNGFGA